MKKIIGMLAVAFCLVGCSKDPDKVVMDFVDAMREGKAEKAVECLSQREIFEYINNGMTEERRKAEFSGVRVLDTVVDGDTAKVKIEHSQNGKTKTAEIPLVKENGNWKIRFINN